RTVAQPRQPANTQTATSTDATRRTMLFFTAISAGRRECLGDSPRSTRRCSRLPRTMATTAPMTTAGPAQTAARESIQAAREAALGFLPRARRYREHAARDALASQRMAPAATT